MSLFQRRALLNHLTAQHQFYSAKMSDGERVLAYMTRIIQLSADLKAMEVTITDQELCTTKLCSLPHRFEGEIVSINTIAEGDKLTVEFVKIRIIQEEKKMNIRTANSAENDAALLNTRASNRSSRSTPTCPYCNKRGHLEAACCTKHPHLEPEQQGSIVEPESEATNEVDDHICFAAITPLLLRLALLLGNMVRGYSAHCVQQGIIH